MCAILLFFQKREVCAISFEFSCSFIKRSFPKYRYGAYITLTTASGCRAQGTDGKRLFNGTAELLLDQSKTSLSLEIAASFSMNKFSIGKTVLYNNGSPIDIISKGGGLQWVSLHVLDLNSVHSTTLITSFKFILQVDLLYPEPIIFEPALNIIDFENSEFFDTIVAVKGRTSKFSKTF